MSSLCAGPLQLRVFPAFSCSNIILSGKEAWASRESRAACRGEEGQQGFLLLGCVLQAGSLLPLPLARESRLLLD